MYVTCNINEFSISNFINVQITRWTFLIMDLDRKFSLRIPYYLEILPIPLNSSSAVEYALSQEGREFIINIFPISCHYGNTDYWAGDTLNE